MSEIYLDVCSVNFYPFIHDMSDCIFCKIVAGEIPCVKLWEDEDFLVILDAFPACKGQTLVLTKHHVHSDIFVLGEEDYCALFVAAKKTVSLLKT